MAKELEQPPILNVPTYFGSTVGVSSNGNEVTLTFSRMSPAKSDTTVQVPVVSISVPRGTANDLAMVLGNVVKSLNETFGEIDTPYLKGLREPTK